MQCETLCKHSMPVLLELYQERLESELKFGVCSPLGREGKLRPQRSTMMFSFETYSLLKLFIIYLPKFAVI